MAKRIVAGQIMHESSSVAKDLTEVENFKRTLIWYDGEDVWELSRLGMKDYLTGIMDTGRSLGLDISPCFCTFASPSGRISRNCFETLQRHFFDGINDSEPIDGFCLALHGAGVSEVTPDVEGYTIEKIRERFGKDVPIYVTLDPHANITEKMMDNATVLLPSKLYPHTDTYETGGIAIEMMKDMLEGRISPVQHIERIPMLIPITKGCTEKEPMKSVLEMCNKAEENDKVLHCTFAQGFPYSDIEECGAAVVVTTDGDKDIAKKIACEIAQYVIDHKDDFRSDCLGVSEGLDAAEKLLAKGNSVIVINEASDNPGAGTPGDGTWLLKELLDRDIPKSCMAIIVDPETVKTAVSAGVGSNVDVLVGGKTDDMHGAPVELKGAYVKSICDGKYSILSPMTHGQPVNYGTTVRLVHGNVDIIVVENAFQTMDDGVMSLTGINFRDYNIIGVKSAQHFRAYFGQFTQNIITVDPPGISTGNLSTLRLNNVKRPIFPLDV